MRRAIRRSTAVAAPVPGVALETDAPDPPAGARRFRSRRALAIAAALIVLLVLGADAAVRVRDARRHLLTAREELQSARQALEPLLQFDAARWPDGATFQAARTELADAERHLAEGRARLGYLRGALRLIPPLPAGLDGARNVPELLAFTQDFVAHARAATDTAAPLFDQEAHLPSAARQVFVERGAELEETLRALSEMQGRLAALSAEPWVGPLAPVDPLLDELATAMVRLPEGVELVELLQQGLDPLLGYGGPSTYLLLGQNDHEIRATGGFIGTTGIVTVADGRVLESSYGSSYDLDDPDANRPPPEPMSRYGGFGQWHIRDGNWAPDFRETARTILDFAAEDRGLHPDGVVAVDSEFVALLLDVFGPIEVENYPRPLTRDNWFLLVEGALHADAVEQTVVGPEREEQKQTYMEPVMRQLLDRVQAATGPELPALLRALEAAAAGRHLQVFHREAAVQALVAHFNADGRMDLPTAGDFVAVVDANLSYTKIQPAIVRSLTYVRREDGLVDLVLRWENRLSQFEGARYARLGIGGGIWDRQRWQLAYEPGVYGTYTRVYVPAGVTDLDLIGFDGPPALAFEGDFAVLSGFIAVSDGETATVVLSYRPAPGHDPADGIRFWKQGGAAPLQLDVLWNTDGAQERLFQGALERDRSVPIHPDE